MTFHKRQKVWLTGGTNGEARLPAVVVDVYKDGGLFVRVDVPHKLAGDYIWKAGSTWKFYPNGTDADNAPYIIPREDTDYRTQWPAIQAYAKGQGLDVPDLPEPVDPLLLQAREAAAEYWRSHGYPNTGREYLTGKRDKVVSVQSALTALRLAQEVE